MVPRRGAPAGAGSRARGAAPLAGSRPPRSLVRPGGPGGRGHGLPASDGQAYNDVACVVVPLRRGAGVKFKTVEAIRAGFPVVTTTVGAEGVEAAAGRPPTPCTTTPSRSRSAVARVLTEPPPARSAAAGGVPGRALRDAFLGPAPAGSCTGRRSGEAPGSRPSLRCGIRCARPPCWSGSGRPCADNDLTSSASPTPRRQQRWPTGPTSRSWLQRGRRVLGVRRGVARPARGGARRGRPRGRQRSGVQLRRRSPSLARRQSPAARA